MGMVRTRRAARQLLNHSHIQIDGARVDIPTFRVKPGQTISVREKSKNFVVIKEALEVAPATKDFGNFDAEKLEGTFVRLPERSELNGQIQEQLVVEYYSR
jgi:small subunit ribosomal protein S4